MGFISRFISTVRGTNDVGFSMMFGGVIGSILAAYQYDGISVAAIRPVVEPVLNSLGLIWPEGM